MEDLQKIFEGKTVTLGGSYARAGKIVVEIETVDKDTDNFLCFYPAKNDQIDDSTIHYYLFPEDIARKHNLLHSICSLHGNVYFISRIVNHQDNVCNIEISPV